MSEFIKSFPEVIAWLIGVLATGSLGMLIYFVKENIDVLKKLNVTVNEILLKFAVHEKDNEGIRTNVSRIEGRVEGIVNDIKEVKTDVEILKGGYNKYTKLL